MFNVSNPLVKIGITSVACTIPAIATTIYRLWIRRGRYWADDAWAFLSAIAQLLLFTGAFVRITHSNQQDVMIAFYYIMAAAFYAVIWFARLSILFSIIRIDPCANRRRRLFLVASCFAILPIVLVSQLFWVCEPQPRWKERRYPQCRLTREVIILQLVTDVLADMILIISPLKVIQRLSDQSLRRRLSIIFSTCLVTTVVSLVHAALLFVHPDYRVVIAAIVEVCVSLVVCNIPVVITSLLQIRRETKRNVGPSGPLRFASYHSDVGDLAVAPNGTTTTSLWTSHFRWERHLRDSNSERTTTSTILSAVDTTKTHMEMQLPETSAKEPSGDIYCATRL